MPSFFISVEDIAEAVAWIGEGATWLCSFSPMVSSAHTSHLPCKGLQLRLELGNVVTGEGERGESGSWRLDG